MKSYGRTCVRTSWQLVLTQLLASKFWVLKENDLPCRRVAEHVIPQEGSASTNPKAIFLLLSVFLCIQGFDVPEHTDVSAFSIRFAWCVVVLATAVVVWRVLFLYMYLRNGSITCDVTINISDCKEKINVMILKTWHLPLFSPTINLQTDHKDEGMSGRCFLHRRTSTGMRGCVCAPACQSAFPLLVLSHSTDYILPVTPPW